MKKKSIKSLKLNKKVICNPITSAMIKGGGTHYHSVCDCPITIDDPGDAPTTADMCDKTMWGAGCPDW